MIHMAVPHPHRRSLRPRPRSPLWTPGRLPRWPERFRSGKPAVYGHRLHQHLGYLHLPRPVAGGPGLLRIQLPIPGNAVRAKRMDGYFIVLSAPSVPFQVRTSAEQAAYGPREYRPSTDKVHKGPTASSGRALMHVWRNFACNGPQTVVKFILESDTE